MTPWWQLPRDSRSAFLQMARRSQGKQSLFLHDTIQQRMLERAQCMRLPAGGDVLDLSWGVQAQAIALQRQYQHRQVHAMSWAKKPAPSWAYQFKQLVTRVLPEFMSDFLGFDDLVHPLQWHEFWYEDKGAGDLNRLIPDNLPEKMAMIWSNALLHRLADPLLTVKYWREALMPDGVLFFSCFGPDTACELRAVSQAMGLPFADWRDMHDWGDALVQAGFADPVMEMEKLTLTYSSPKQLLEDWHAAGGNCLAVRRLGCMGSAALKRCYGLLENLCQGRLQMTVEVIYGHAWRIDRAPKGGEIRIPVEQIRRKKTN